MDPYLLDLIEEIVAKKIGMTIGTAEASGHLRADNGEFMEIDDTNEENVVKAVGTWSGPTEDDAAALKGKHDLDPPAIPPAPMP